MIDRTLRNPHTEASVYAYVIPGITDFVKSQPEVLTTMFNQKLHAADIVEFEIAEELRYETDPCELKLDEMIEAEPEPEMIEGLPASDALTPADRYLELFEHVQSSRLFADSKTFPDCAPKMDPLDILIRYRKVRRHRDFYMDRFEENNL